MVAIYQRLVQLGTSGLSHDAKNDVVLLNTSGIMGTLVCLVTLIISLRLGSTDYAILNLITGAVCMAVLVLNHMRWVMASMSIVSFVIPALMIGYIYLFGNMGAEYYLFVGMMIGIYFFRNVQLGISSAF